MGYSLPMRPRTGAARALAAARLCPALAALIVASLLAPVALGATDGRVRASLAVATGAQHLVPADGVASTTLVATATDSMGRPVAGRPLFLRPLDPASGAHVAVARQLTGADGVAHFEVSGTRPGGALIGLFDRGRGANLVEPLARLRVDFTRKVVLLAPGFGSALATRFGTFGTPTTCLDPAAAGSVYAVLTCLGYAADERLDGSISGTTVVDMSWNAVPCLPTDVPGAPDCVATIRRTAGARDVHWQPAGYDLTSFALGMGRQVDVDLWAERLARTIAIYDAELYATAGMRSSFYLVGHSLGGEVALRTLRVLADSRLGTAFADDRRGLLQAVVSVDGALNWAGAVAFLSAPRCGLPVQTVADLGRAYENAQAVERAFDLFGTRTVAVTSAVDPIVGPAVALLSGPLAPRRGYHEALFHADLAPDALECTHSTLLWPESAGAVRYPLAELLADHVGQAAGAAVSVMAKVAPARIWRLFGLRA